MYSLLLWAKTKIVPRIKPDDTLLIKNVTFSDECPLFAFCAYYSFVLLYLLLKYLPLIVVSTRILKINSVPQNRQNTISAINLY